VHKVEKKYIIIIIVLLLGLLIVTASLNKYETPVWDPSSFTYQDNKICAKYDKRCSCIGIIQTLFSNPLQYNCLGIKFCKEIDITKCG